MSQFTPKERVNRLFRREPIDTMPIFSGMGMVTMQAIEQLGIRFSQVHTREEHLAESALATAEMFGFDAAIVPYDMGTVPEAMGCGISLYEASEEILYPTVPNKWTSVDEVKIPEDILSKARMPLVDRAFEILKSRTNGQIALGAWVLGPFTMAGQVLELDILLRGLKKNKEATEALLEKMTGLVLKLAQHYEFLGVDYITIREMGSGVDIISPRIWRSAVQANLTKIFKAIEIPTVNHICGSTDLIVEPMNECGATAISVDHKNNVAETRKKLGDDVLILGYFDAYKLLVQGDVDAVAPAIKKCMDDGVDAVWPGCDIWPAAKKENVLAYVKTIRENGRKPSPAVGRV